MTNDVGPSIASQAGVAGHAAAPAKLRNGPSSYHVLYTFAGAPKDGASSYAGLVGVNGTFYGTTSGGGYNNKGTVFSITPSGSETVLYNFSGGGDGGNPYGGLINVNGTLYGTTRGGGANGLGTVFKIGTSGGESVVFSFTGPSSGATPYGSLVNVNGALYGTTLFGGARNLGTVFKIAKAGTETVVYSFGGGSDGAEPYAGLLNVGGTLYGTTYGGGANGEGTVFSIAPNGNETVLHSFGGTKPVVDGAYPVSGLIAVGSTLYGTTSIGGTNNDGTVYALTPAGNESVVWNFAGFPNDGEYPAAALTYVSGTLYGTTSAGGTKNQGTVFTVSTSGTENVLYGFLGGTDGADPYGGLTTANGMLYGTTQEAGTGCDGSGCGTVFALPTSTGGGH